MKKTGSAVNRAIKKTKAAMSILLPQRFEDRALLTDDTRASTQKFNRVNRIPLLLGAAAAQDGGDPRGRPWRCSAGRSPRTRSPVRCTPKALQGDKVYAPGMMAVAFEAAECGTATPTEQQIHDILMG
jgi:hypothetical protein